MRRYLPIVICFAAAMILLSFTASDAAEIPEGWEKGTVTGRVMIKDGGPLSGGQVLFFDASVGPPPMPYKYERTPDIAKDLDDEGRFSVELPVGKYYLGAIKRSSGERMGPPQPGDYVFRDTDENGVRREYIVQNNGVIDVGTVSAEPLEKGKLLSKGVTAIQGKVIAQGGKPVANAVVAAFVTPALRGRPLFVSEKTGKDGKYILRVPPGTYFLRVRNAFTTGAPDSGQIVGQYGEGDPAPVSVKEGKTKKGINLNVILFPGRGPFTDTAPEKK